MAKTQVQQKPYWEMNLKELREATKEFDGPINPSRLKPLSKAERARWERMRKGPVYSIFVHRAKKRRVTIRVDAGILRRCEAYARERHMTRDQMIERSLAASLTFAGTLDGV
jgi:hypothetical protein